VDVFEVADRIFVLRLGRPGGVFDAHKASQEDVVAAITGARAHDTGQPEAATET
jgi:D-xylose transport system ATP-binding protein